MAEASSQSNVPTLAEELGSIAARAQTYTGASGAAIALGEGSADEMICRACSGPAAPDIGASIRLEGTFTGMAVQSGQALRCDDSDTDKRVDAAACRALGTRSIVVVPIRDADTEVVSGVLAVFAGSKNAFNDLHVAVLRTMAREVAVAVQKARKQGVTLSTMSMPAYVEPSAPVRPSSPGFKPPVTTATPRPVPVPTPPPMPAPSAAAAAPKTAPVADSAPTVMSPAPRPAAPPPPPPAKLAPPVPPPPPKEDPLAPQPMAAPIKAAAKSAAPPAPEWKPAPPPPLRKVDTPAPFEAHKAATPAPVTFGTFDNVAADKKPGGGGMMIWIGVAAVAVLIVGGYFGYKAFSSGEGSQAKPQQQATQSQPQPQAASTPAPAAASPTPAPASTTTAASTAASQPAASQPAAKPAATPAPAPQPQQQAAKPSTQTQQPPAKPAPQPTQQAVARTLSTPTPNASAPRQEDVRPLPMQTPQVAVPITTSAPTLAATKQSQSTQAQLISSVQPKYPEMARTMHAGGDVVMTAVIGKDGVVKSVKTISGHPLLRGAAENAVRQWRYKPATLNGEPVEATTQVTLKFAPQ